MNPFRHFATGGCGVPWPRPPHGQTPCNSFRRDMHLSLQQMKPPEQRQQSGQGVNDDASIVSEKASVTLFIGVDVVSACTNRGSPCPPPHPQLLRSKDHFQPEPGQGVLGLLSVVVTSMQTTMWCVLRCKRCPARIDFLRGLSVSKNSRTYVRLPGYHSPGH